MKKTYKFKFYRNKKNRFLDNQIFVAAKIWNFCVALQRRYYKLTGKYINPNRLKTHLTKVKRRPRYQYWNQLGSQAIQDVVERLDRAYVAFFESRKNKNGTRKVGLPGFRKVRKYSSFTLKQAGWKLTAGNRIKIGKRSYRFTLSRNIIGTIKTVTIKRTKLGEYFLYFVVNVPDAVEAGEHTTLPQPSPTGRGEQVDRTGQSAVGLDFGLKTFLTFSTGGKVASPEWFKQGLKEIRKANREFSRKKKGSKNRRDALKHLQRVHERIENRRTDWFWKFANELVKRYDCFFFETLNMKAMQRLWGRKINDLAFSKFLLIFKYVAAKHGKTVFQVDRFFPSSKLCSHCGHIHENLQLKDRLWCCPSCDASHDRDVNAAINILHEGASRIGLALVRPALAG